MHRHFYRLEILSPAALSAARPVVSPERPQCAFLGPIAPGDSLCLAAPVSVVDEVSTEMGLRLHTTTAAATLVRTIPPPPVQAGFLFTATDGARYLLGLPFAPHPLSVVSSVHPAEFTSPTVATLTLKWTSPWPLLEII